jgi:hypothetical protein
VRGCTVLWNLTWPQKAKSDGSDGSMDNRRHARARERVLPSEASLPSLIEFPTRILPRLLAGFAARKIPLLYSFCAW